MTANTNMGHEGTFILDGTPAQTMITVNAEGLQLPAEIVSRMLIEMSKKPSYRAAFRESLATALLGEK